MAKEKKADIRAAKKAAQSSSPGKEFWKIVAGVAAALVALLFGASFLQPSMSPGTRQLYNDLQQNMEHLERVSQGGDGEVFDDIKEMAARVALVLDEAKKTKGDFAKKAVLQKGMDLKKEWSSLLRRRKALDAKPSNALVQGRVVNLGEANFTKWLGARRYPYLMLEFYAPWCGHCRKLAPGYASLARRFKGQVGFAAVNAEIERTLAAVYNITRYPTVKFLVRGLTIDYPGQPSEEPMATWLTNRMQPSYADVDQVSDVVDALAQVPEGGTSMSIISGEGGKGTPTYEAFVTASEKYRGKVVFTWAPAGSGEAIRIYRAGGAPPETCGEGGEGGDAATACDDHDVVIKWIRERLGFDDEAAFADSGEADSGEEADGGEAAAATSGDAAEGEVAADEAA